MFEPTARLDDARLNDEERAIVEVVREFTDREIRPSARELEHAGF